MLTSFNFVQHPEAEDFAYVVLPNYRQRGALKLEVPGYAPYTQPLVIQDQASDNCSLVLLRRSTLQVKHFYMAAHPYPESVSFLEKFMSELTDGQLLQWFEKRGGKPKKEKKDGSVVSEPVPEGGDSPVAQASA